MTYAAGKRDSIRRTGLKTPHTVTLLQLIDLTLLEPIDGKRFRSLRTILADFPEGDVDILLTAVPGWARRFVDFLAKYPNRLRKDTTLSEANRRLYLITLRKLLRKAVAQGLYPDVDPVLPFISDGRESRRGPRRYEGGIPDHRAELLRLCALHLEGEADTLRRLYYMSLLCAGIELPQLLTLRVAAEGRRMIVTTAYGTPLRNSEAILSLAAPLKAPEPGTSLLPAELEQKTYLSNPSGIRNSGLHPGAVFSDLICMAAQVLPFEAVATAISSRLLTPEDYMRDLPRYQALFTGTFTDGGALVPRWFALRSVSPRKSGEDVSQAISHDKDLSDLVAESYVPTDSIVVERRGKKITRNNPAVRNLIFIKTVAGSVGQILRHVDDVAAYRRGRGDTYATVPYAEIYRMKLVLGAYGSDPHTDILTDEELHAHFSTDQLSIGDTVTVSRPGYEQFTAKVIKRKNKDTYCVSFDNFGFHVIMQDIPRALITKL